MQHTFSKSMDRDVFDRLPNIVLTDTEYLYNIPVNHYISQSIRSNLITQGRLRRKDMEARDKVEYVYDAKAKLDVALSDKSSPASTQSRRIRATDCPTQNSTLQYKRATRYVIADEPVNPIPARIENYVDRLYYTSLRSRQLEYAICATQLTDGYEEPTKSRYSTIFKPLLKLECLKRCPSQLLRQHTQDTDCSREWPIAPSEEASDGDTQITPPRTPNKSKSVLNLELLRKGRDTEQTCGSRARRPLTVSPISSVINTPNSPQRTPSTYQFVLNRKSSSRGQVTEETHGYISRKERRKLRKSASGVSAQRTRIRKSAIPLCNPEQNLLHFKALPFSEFNPGHCPLSFNDRDNDQGEQDANFTTRSYFASNGSGGQAKENDALEGLFEKYRGQIER